MPIPDKYKARPGNFTSAIYPILEKKGLVIVHAEIYTENDHKHLEITYDNKLGEKLQTLCFELNGLKPADDIPRIKRDLEEYLKTHD